MVDHGCDRHGHGQVCHLRRHRLLHHRYRLCNHWLLRDHDRRSGDGLLCYHHWCCGHRLREYRLLRHHYGGGYLLHLHGDSQA
jgi:hypothetical protein